MCDSNLSEIIVTKITNIIKENIIFAKKERINNIFIGLTICSSLFGIITIYNTYICFKIENKINTIGNIVKDSGHLPMLYYKTLLYSNNIINKVYENQINIEKKIDNIPL
jgi:hypothetical protein